MLGCLRRLGCLTLLAIAAALYVLRDEWRPLVPPPIGTRTPPPASRSAENAWQSLTPERAERGERAVRTLAAPRGPVYVTLQAGELASYAFLSLSATLPGSPERAQAAVLGDRIFVRTVVSAEDLGGLAGGTLGALVTERDTLVLGGTLEVLHPGLAQFRITDLRLGAIPIPARAIPPLVRRLSPRPPPADVAPDALPVRLPPHIGDVRIARNLVTLYRSAP